MNADHLRTYLNDHLSGSEAGVQLAARIAEAYPNTDFSREVQRLHAEIEQDQRTLQGMLDRVAGGGSALKQVAGWVAEQLTRVKLTPVADPLAVFEGLEALSLGILGKRALWRTLVVVATEEPAFSDQNFGELARRARDQWERVEVLRLRAAAGAFGDKVAGLV